MITHYNAVESQKIVMFFNPFFRWFYLFSFWFAINLCLINDLQAQETEPTSVTSRPKIGLALSGGGARGMAHVGVLKALEELQIPIDYIAGTSMGSIVGGLYASGVTAKQLHHAAVEGINWQAILSTSEDLETLSYREKQNRRRFLLNLEMGIGRGHITVPSGWIGGHTLFLELKRFTNGIETKDFSQLPIPFKAVATDLKTAQPYLIEKGDLALALRASMAVPFLFSPVEIDGHVLVDGGILANLPVDVVREMGAEIIIAVNVSAPLSDIESGSSFFQISRQSIDAALIQNTRQALEHADIVITPELDGHSSANFSNGEKLIAQGYEAVKKKTILLKNLSLSPQAYAEYQTQLQARIPTQTRRAVKAEFIKFDGYQRTNPQILAETVGDSLVGRLLSIEEVELATKHLMSLNDFENVTYDIQTNEQGKTGLIFNIREKAWGPDYFRFGINAATTLEGKADVSLLVRHEKLNINRFGAEWINEIKFGTGFAFLTEFYQPLDYSKNYFLVPYAQYQREFNDVFREQTAIAEYDIRRLRFGVNVGRNFGNAAVLQMGLRSSTEEARVRVGDPTLSTGNFQENAFTLDFGYDTLDDRVFATRGIRIALNAEIHDDWFGSDTQYQKMELYTRQHAKLTKNFTFVSELNLGTFFQSTPPEYESFSINRIGGLGGLGGFTQGDIGGRQTLLMSVGGLLNPQALMQFGESKVRLLAMLHAGNAWNDYEDINFDELHYGGLSALVWDTQFGTLQLGAGYTSEGSLRYSLSLGNFF